MKKNKMCLEYFMRQKKSFLMLVCIIVEQLKL